MNNTYIKKYREFINNIGKNIKQDKQMWERVKFAYKIALRKGIISNFEEFLKYLYNNPGKELELILEEEIKDIEKEIEYIKC